MKQLNIVYQFLLAMVFTFACSTSNAAPMQISLITCGTGDELYASFGHSGIRIVDSANGSDNIYNYGMFNFGDPNFYSKFVKGTLLYYSAAEPSEQFMYAYQMDKREVKEQVLNLNDSQCVALKKILDNNNLEQNKYYKYDFLFNNCSTKLRDIFDTLLGNQLVYKKVLPDDSLTFMQMLNSYLTTKHASRIGIDIILCSRVNDMMDNRESMFLPEWLSDNFAAATINGQSMVKETKMLLPDGEQKSMPFNVLKWLFLIISIAGIWFSVKKPSLVFWKWFDAVLFTTLGLLGCLFLFMWFVADHVETNHNACLLWALPTHLFWAYLANKKKFENYANISLFLAGLAIVIVHPLLQSTALEIYPLIALIIVRLFSYTSWQKNNH
jgi:Domain of unknown function (DUF4105)